MRTALLVVLLSHPRGVTSIGGDRNPDGTITVVWTLPSDPSIVGVTVERERLDKFDDLIVFELSGSAVSLTDLSASGSGSYRYWVYTRNAGDEFSNGAFLEVISPSDLDDDHWECFAGASSAPASPAWPFFLAGLLGLTAFIKWTVGFIRGKCSRSETRKSESAHYDRPVTWLKRLFMRSRIPRMAPP